MKKYLFLVLLWSVCLFADSNALIVGVGKYENGLNALYGVHKDIENIQVILQTLNVQKENMNILEDEKATLNGVREAFRQYIISDKNKLENIFVFYYSGHGLQVVDKSGDEEDHWDEATALYDINATIGKVITLKNGENRQIAILHNGVLLDDELYTLLSKIKSKKIIIFDKCNSDSSTRGIAVDFVKGLKEKFVLSPSFSSQIDILPRSEKILQNYVALFATKDNEKAEDSPLGGLFTESLLQAIVYKKAVGGDRVLTLDRLRDFCQSNIKILANQYKKRYQGLALKGEFTPVFKPNEYLDSSITELFGMSLPFYEANIKPYLLEDTLDGLVSNDTLKIQLEDDLKEYRLRERVSLAFSSEKEGYLNVLLVYKDSYKLFMKNKKIDAKKDYVFPDDFFAHKTLRAAKPLGKTKVFFILSLEPWDIESNIKKLKSDDMDLVRSLSRELMPTVTYSKVQSRDIFAVQKIEKPNLLSISKIEFITRGKQK